MRKPIRPVVLVSLMSAWTLLAAACGGKSALRPPAADLTGVWLITSTATSSGCGQDTGDQSTITATVTHEEGSNSFTLSVDAYGTANGTIDGDHLTFGFSATADDCAPLVVSMDMTLDSSGDRASGTGDFDCTYTGGSCGGQYTVIATRISGGSSAGLAAAVCAKYEACALLGPIAPSICQATLASIEMYVIDSERASSCLAQASCAQVQDEAFLEQCLAYDTARFECNGNTLHFCDTFDACKDIDCEAACEQFFPGTSGSCGFVSEDGYNKCICSQ